MKNRRSLPILFATLLFTVALDAATFDDLELLRAGSEGRQVSYRARGHGSQALVFLHGWAGDSSVWKRQAGILPGMPAFFVDLPGHGASDVPEGPCTVDRLASGVTALLEAEGVDRAILVAHSNGVVVAREVLRRSPERVAALLLIDGPLRPAFPLDVYGPIVERLREPEWQELLSGMVPVMEETLREEVQAMMLRTDQEVLASSLEAMSDPEVWKDDPIAIPVTHLLAASPFWDEDYERFVRGLAPDTDYQVVEGVGHYLMMERPDLVAEALHALLARLEVSGAPRPAD